MSSRRPPAPPPDLPGFTYEALLGSGGFADVFLYRQQLPERRVAVKVLLPDRLAQGSDAFTAEANIMAQLSTHPAIVTIYQAGISADQRPYLVMEYCPKPNLQVRYRREPFSIAESLRVGVQVAAAVETAHRAGILHRDIKPANILVTEYNRPALTDFGIAVAAGDDEESAGMSIPWSPPEAFADEARTGVTTDVWALGATVYTLLAGRSPFELPGERNTSAELIQRIESLPLPRLGRADAPASLEAVLDRAMSKAPSARYVSALDFARALQRVQIELSMAPTPIDVLEEAGDDADPAHDEDGGLTRIRNVVSIDPTGAGVSTAGPAARATGGMPRFDPPATTRRNGTIDGATGGAAGAADATTPGTVDGTTSSATVLRPPALPAQGTPTFTGDADAATVLRPHVVPAQATPPHAPTPGGALNAAPGIASGVAPGHAPAAGIAPGVPGGPAPARRGSRGGLIAAIVAGVVVLGGAGFAWAAAAGVFGEAEPTASAEPTSEPIDGVVPDDPVPRVDDLVGTVQGTDVVFTWTNPAPEDGDVYLWNLIRPGEEVSLSRTSEATVTVPAEATGRTCIAVLLVRSSGRSATEPVEGCAP